jgi:hypothetical protein
VPGQWPVASGQRPVAPEWGKRRGCSRPRPGISRGTEAREAREACDAREESMKGICALAEARAGQVRAVSLRAVDEFGRESEEGGGDGDGDGDRVEGS